MKPLYEYVDSIPEDDDEYDYFEVDEVSGRVALCTLGSMNWGAFRNPEDMKRACRLLHRSLNNILDYQDFLSYQSYLSNQEIRPLGIGVTNLAYWHAKRGYNYGDSDALQEIKSWVEHQTYFLMEANVDLAKERGKCADSDKTRYGQGIFVWELRAEGVNELVDFTPELDWETLRNNMKTYGVRNATVGAIAPVESCQRWSNKINLADGTLKNFHELLDEQGIDWQEIEASCDPNTIIPLNLPISVSGIDGVEEVSQIVYNGVANVNRITFEDGTTMDFTDNHRLLVRREDGTEQMVCVFELKEGDDVIQIVQPDQLTTH